MKSLILAVLFIAATKAAWSCTENAAAGSGLFPRRQAPCWNGMSVQGEDFFPLSSSQYADKWTILLFYPFDFTYVCPTELVAFSDAMGKFRDLNAAVVGISTDSHHTHLAWLKMPRNMGGLGEINYPLVSDFGKTISRSFGVLVEDPSDPMFGAALRGLFIIDANGKLRHTEINDDQVGRSVEEVLRTVEAFQFADANGQVCPSTWRKKGDATITPDQKAKLQYFGGL